MCKQKTVKKFIYLAAALILLAFIPAVSMGAEDDFVIEDGVLVRYTGTETEIIIPDGVTIMGNSLFRGSAVAKLITSIVIPESVTRIGYSVFNNFELTEIIVSENNPEFSSVDGVLFNEDKTILIKYPAAKPEISYDIPSSVTSIDRDAFFMCKNLVSVTLPDGITEIDGFFGCSSLASIVIPDSVTSINGAFSSCHALTSIVIPDSVTSIHNAFNYCTSLTSIMIPDSVTIGASVFERCTSLTAINVSENHPEYSNIDGVLFSKDKTKLILYPAGKPDTIYTIPSSAKIISYSAFYSCDNLINVILPDGLEEIDFWAFQECNSLVSILIPASVTRIRDGAFDGKSLTEIIVSEDNPIYSSLDGVLFNKEKTSLIRYPIAKPGTSYDVPSGVIYISFDSFKFCGNLTSVTMPEGLERIADYAFWGCGFLASVVIPDRFTSFRGSNVFCGLEDILTIYGVAGSYAEKYAEDNEIKFQEI